VALSQWIGRQTAEKGLDAKFNKDIKFFITRSKTSHGLQVYSLENKAAKQKIIIPRELFDRFRSALSLINDRYADESESHVTDDQRIFLEGRDYFSIHSTEGDSNSLVIQELIKQPGSTGFLKLPVEALTTLTGLLYDDRLDHPSDVFDRIIDYHKAFRFTFSEGSESMTSGLALRKDALSQITEYVPALRQKAEDNKIFFPGEDVEALNPKGADSSREESTQQANKFKSKLGQRDGKDAYSVDYDALFNSPTQKKTGKTPKAANDETRSGAEPLENVFPLPLIANDMKSFQKRPFRCEFSKEDIADFREHFLLDKESELYLGFEIIDAIYRSHGKLKTYRFPLYYMKVTLEESGRYIDIFPPENGQIFLNHLGLATIVESFGATKAGVDPVAKFFDDLLSQKVEIDGYLTRLQLTRKLPFKEEVFERTRDILLGLPGENGKGGLLYGLKLVGIECDLESVAIYKSQTCSSPVNQALEVDLDRIQHVAHRKPHRFYQSILGQLLTPEYRADSSDQEQVFAQKPYMPGAAPKATRSLFNKLNQHNIVLLEGPPGTGKTFTIMNLVIHCLAQNKSLLVVSDQKAAIQALTEKLQEYFLGREMNAPHTKPLQNLWLGGVKIVDEAPQAEISLADWISQLSAMLKFDETREPEIPSDQEHNTVLKELHECDRKIEEIKNTIGNAVRQGKPAGRIAPKYTHPTTVQEIDDLVSFLGFLGAGQHEKRRQNAAYGEHQILVKAFRENRQTMAKSELSTCYDDLYFEQDQIEDCLAWTTHVAQVVGNLVERKPRKMADFEAVVAKVDECPTLEWLYQNFEQAFPDEKRGVRKLIQKTNRLIKHPCLESWQLLHEILLNQQKLLKTLQKLDNNEQLGRAFSLIHQSLHPKNQAKGSLLLDICHFTQDLDQKSQDAIHNHLKTLRDLQALRDQHIRNLFTDSLRQTTYQSMVTRGKQTTSAITTLQTLLSGLKECKSLQSGHGVSLHRDLQRKLRDTFPVWICRKQAVPFLFPTEEKQFDLVIVDEAGQCRVDDALPLLYRARKFMVVGDEKQTVLAKDSVIDDYLFREFNLEEHLHSVQARGMKGGGSHIFGLVKSIKQAGVMLDEHYRCPPDIIRYSNEYVYNSDLKVMQWTSRLAPPAVVVDYSEEKAKSNKKPTSGKFKGIETDMIDRFFDYIAKQIPKLEKEYGRPINVETDVAICYFLLKNEPYIKEKKRDFLRKLNRGQDVLDGAGAALQGKERDFIFYLWDVTRANMASFRQGDDPDKRKGELNVLMSRPKKRAFHYLHQNFADLKHETATITDYLWKQYQRQSVKTTKKSFVPRQHKPGPEFRPWQRSSGQLMKAALSHMWQTKHKRVNLEVIENSQCSVIVGDPHFKVDLMLLADGENLATNIGLIDLSAFIDDGLDLEALIDYYFQLCRAVPKIEPIFLFIHELTDERSFAFRYLEEKMGSGSPRKKVA
jgi:hypothetical protein